MKFTIKKQVCYYITCEMDPVPEGVRKPSAEEAEGAITIYKKERERKGKRVPEDEIVKVIE